MRMIERPLSSEKGVISGATKLVLFLTNHFRRACGVCEKFGCSDTFMDIKFRANGQLYTYEWCGIVEEFPEFCNEVDGFAETCRESCAFCGA